MVQLMLLCAAIVSAILAGIVIANNYGKPVNRIYSLLSLTATVWLSANALVIDGFFTPSDPGLYLSIGRLITPSAIILSYLLLIFILLFSYQSVTAYKTTLGVLALPGALITGLSFTDWNVSLAADGFLRLGGLSMPFALVVLIYLGLAAYFLFFRIRHIGSDIYLIQTRYLRQAFLTSILPAVLFGAVVPLFTSSQISNLGPLFSTIFLLSAAWLIIRHRLFDIRPIVARVIAYAMLLFTTIGFFSFFAIFITQHTLEITNEFISRQLVPVALAIVFAILFHPAKKFFDRITNRLFYQDAYDPQVFLNDLNKTIVATIDTNQLLEQVESVIDRNLKSSYSIFLVKGVKMHVIESATGSIPKMLDDILNVTSRLPEDIVYTDDLIDRQNTMAIHKMLASERIAVIAKLSTHSDGNRHGGGVLILGDKKSGSTYNRQDRRILEIVVSELVIAIQNSLRFEEIQRFNETLQEKIEEATRKLRQTNDKLRKLDETKDDFISMASHQLRTPLTSVKGYVSMVLDGDAGKITGLQRKLLTQSFVSSQRMVYLISDLLNVSRLKTGKFIIEPTPTSLAAVIEEEIDQLQETAKGRNLKLTYHRPEHFPTLMLDETKIRQVLMNFIDNAVYYTPSGGHIAINLADRPNAIEFTVVDDGIGVPKHEQHHLFTKFFRAHNAKRARPDGTGLGLFMAKKVIIAQGGAVIFKSQEGRGSTFGFTFAKQHLLPKTVPAKKAAKSTKVVIKTH